MEVGYSLGNFEQFSPNTDLHTRNLAFTLPCMDNMTEENFIEMLGKPEIGYVRRHDCKGLEPGMPEYVVRPTSFRMRSSDLSQTIKIIDFGESFLARVPPTLHTPLAVRAPEIIFKDRIDYRVDLWSMGCMVRFIQRQLRNNTDSFDSSLNFLWASLLSTASW